MFVKAVLRSGHVGRGKYHEMTRFLAIDNMVDVLNVAWSMPRVKKNNLALISCEQISKAEYIKGKLQEAQDPYLKTFKYKEKKGGDHFDQRLHGNTA